MTKSVILLASAIALSACQSDAPVAGMPGNTDDTAPFAEIAASETVQFVSTEPFWAGRVAGTAMTYSTPEKPDGDTFAVQRFAGRGGMSWSGMFDGARFALAVTPASCSDGMSDRRYPFVATLQVRGEQRSGCAWTDAKPFTGPREP